MYNDYIILMDLISSADNANVSSRRKNQIQEDSTDDEAIESHRENSPKQMGTKEQKKWNKTNATKR